jgi:protein CLEC16A
VKLLLHARNACSSFDVSFCVDDRYLHAVLGKNAVVTERNRNLLVESIRSIAEILIWGDQNDAKVFDFFLEKNMFRAFLKILQQRTSRYVPVQLLQTLNILFENIRNETSIYYLLSNNHVNAFIVHRYDFSDEEVSKVTAHFTGVFGYAIAVRNSKTH